MGQSQFPLVVALPAFTYTQFSISAVCLKRLKVLGEGEREEGGQQLTLNSLERANEGPTKKRRKLVARPQDTLHTPLMSSERGSSANRAGKRECRSKVASQREVEEGRQSQIDAKATWQSKLHSGSEPELRLCCVRTHTNVMVCV